LGYLIFTGLKKQPLMLIIIEMFILRNVLNDFLAIKRDIIIIFSMNSYGTPFGKMFYPSSH
jgi:hypothetical protein